MSDPINPAQTVDTHAAGGGGGGLAGSIHTLGGLPLGPLEPAAWRESNYCTAEGCVSLAEIADGEIALRNSVQPEQGIIRLGREAFSTWIAGIKAGEFDEFA